MLLSVIGRKPWSWRRLISRFKLHLGPFDRLVDQVPTGASVLDVGCGFGLFLGLLATSNRKIRGSGFDRNAASIRQARDIASRLEAMGCPADLRFECRDINDSWPEARFDVVTIIDVLHHLPIALRPGLLAEASARLRPGGLVVVKDISPRPLWRAYANRLTDLMMHRSWARYSSSEEIISWGRNSGLEIVTRERIDRACYGHVLLVFRGPG